MKKYLSIILMALLCIALLGGCSLSKNKDVQTNDTMVEEDFAPYDEDGKDVFEEELDGAEVKAKESKVEDYYGSWKSTSSQAELMYGSIELTVNKNNTWSATITDEDFSGTWKKSSKGLILSSKYINFDLFYSEQNHLVLEERSTSGDESDASLYTVLSKK